MNGRNTLTSATLRMLSTVLFSLAILSCASQRRIVIAKKVYKSETLVIYRVSKNSFKHVSYKKTNDFGNVECNGLVIRNSDEVIIFDTPTNNESSRELIKWVEATLNCKINAIVPTHFHDDCLGGLQAFHDHGIPSYAYFRTIELAKESNYTVPKNSFKDSLRLQVGSEFTIVKFFGEGHTKDNVVGYFPSESVLFGGCMIRAIGMSRGYLADANVNEWSNTVERVKKGYPNTRIVVPGHGNHGDAELLDYTVNLYRAKNFGENQINK
jgi:metallo-beta-lactamase class B